MKSFLFGTPANNPHVHQMGAALAEGGVLGSYVTAGADHFASAAGRRLREAIRIHAASVDRQLRRRTVTLIPPALVRSYWRWELMRVAAAKAGAHRVEDWCWERGEWWLDAHCARLMSAGTFGAFLGVEHGALAALVSARRAGAPGVVAFLSPHHRTREAWVDAEYERLPGLRTAGRRAADDQSGRRDARRDEEARVADWIVTNSFFTTRSIVSAGVPEAKVLTVPLGGPDPMPEAQLPDRRAGVMRFIYVGPVSVRKGAHRLLAVWRRVCGPAMELHFYGQQLLPPAFVAEALAARGGDAVVFHGSIPASELPAIYRQASVLVFPTLCDGFGMVASEALANGLPVITTRNAGAADAIEEGRSGFVLPAGDDEALCAALEYCAAHPDELFDMRRTALASAGHRTWRQYREHFRATVLGALEGRNMTVAPARRIG